MLHSCTCMGNRRPPPPLPPPLRRYKGGYWEEREAGQFTGCRDIFGPGVVETPAE